MRRHRDTWKKSKAAKKNRDDKAENADSQGIPILLCISFPDCLEITKDAIEKGSEHIFDKEKIACHGIQEKTDEENSWVAVFQDSFHAEQDEGEESDGVDKMEPKIGERIGAETKTEGADASCLI